MLLTDWYKIGHPNQYHENTQFVFSNSTNRKSRIPELQETVHFGNQGFIKKYLIEHFRDNFFSIPEQEIIDNYSRRVQTSLGKDLEPLKHQFYVENYPNDPYGHIRHLHRQGKLPLTIWSLPEGTRVPIKVPNTLVYADKNHPEFFWLTNFIETLFSCNTWQLVVSATIADSYRKIFEKYAMETVGNTDFVPFQGHDFSMRGMSSLETAEYSGAAHLLSFLGTDTIPAIEYLEQYYNADAEKELIGTSVPATEHAILCSGTGFYIWDKHDGDWSKIGDAEFQVFKFLITELYPTGIVSIVSDTFDYFQVITDFVVRLKDEIMSRDGKIVIRPDSGDPADIICGTVRFVDKESYENYMKHPQPDYRDFQQKGSIELLWETFGGTITDMGYKLLDSHIGLIYGDSITRDRAIDICQRLKNKGFASINWVAGIGSYTYQCNTRDTFGMAIKATYCEALSSDKKTLYKIPIFKDPKTDDGTKKSAKGLLAVFNVDGKPTLMENATWSDIENCMFEKIFENGELLIETSLKEIRNRLK
jgi:nicotinamide phosphoribosyltransferase